MDLELQLSYLQLLHLQSQPEEGGEGKMYGYLESMLKSEAGRTLIADIDQERDDFAFHPETKAVFYLVTRGPGNRRGLNAIILGDDPSHPHGMTSGFSEIAVLDALEIEGEQLRVDYHWSTDSQQQSMLKDLQLIAGEKVSVSLPIPEKGASALSGEDLKIPSPHD
ncbi:MAG: hypothetical protein ACPG31_09340 [Planctomycetota bacterium]